MAEVDDRAFDNMRRATDRAPDRLFEEGRVFTESEYNTRATTVERGDYDSRAYFLLKDLYSEDKKKDRFQTLNFSQYLQNLDNDYLEEKFLHARKDDPEYYRDAGKLLDDIYGGDVEQLKLSAYNVYGGIGTPEETKGYRRDRSNVSIKAPQAEQY
jgi:hypothetical protein